ncbi:MAG: exosortase C-terminal domain/associated protein EpsI [Candidatus Korobacteraceae bacterium]
MKSSMRFWLMILVLGGATAGMAMLSHGEVTPMAKSLKEFPQQILTFNQVADVPMDKDTLEVLKPSDYLMRMYYSPGQGELGLYIAYFQTQRGGQTIHSPKNCLPAAGWQPTVNTVETLALADGRNVPVNKYIIRKDLDEQVVLYWYQSHGRIIANEYLGKFYLAMDALRLNRTDAALVRITAPVVNGDEKEAEQRATGFAKKVAMDVEQIIPR